MTTRAALLADIDAYFVRTFEPDRQNAIIREAEAFIRRNLRVQEMIVSGQLTLAPIAGTAAGSVALPDGWLEFRRVSVDSVDGPNLTMLSAEDFFSRRSYFQGHGPEDVYCIEGGQLYAAPGGSSTLNVGYYTALDPLTEPTDTNAVLANAYDLYLYTCLMAAAEFEQDFEMADRNRARASGIIEALNRNNRRARISGGAPQQQVAIGP
ncbi:MAG: hypothetical protein V2J24_23650 [Pseudomonadales bacterium]|nr:hypothetical protein [Pseudomonadales bacterium]